MLLTTFVAVALAAAQTTTHSYDYCAVLSLIAEKTMEQRQNGVSMAHQLDTLTGYSPNVQETAKTLILDAYSVQKFETDASKRAAVLTFGQQTMSSCYQVRVIT